MNQVSKSITIYNLVISIEKKGKFLSFLKAKTKPRQPRRKKAEFELKTTLESYKRRKIEVPIVRNA